jgi:hypothetical protein
MLSVIILSVVMLSVVVPKREQTGYIFVKTFFSQGHEKTLRNFFTIFSQFFLNFFAEK